MSRLPIPGQDDGTWGQILNDFLSQSLKPDGTLKDDIVTSAMLAPDAVDTTALADNSVTATQLANSAVTAPKLDTTALPTSGQVLSWNGSSLVWVTSTGSGPVPDADSTTKGLVQLAGDLTGTASSPAIAAGAITATKIANITITDTQISASAAIAQSKISGLSTSLSGKQDLDSDLTAIAALTAADDDILQRKSGAWTNRTTAQVKTDLVLVKADVGLANADNTSDTTKNAATATLTNKTISGASNTLTSIAQSSVTNLTTDLAGKAAAGANSDITSLTGLTTPLTIGQGGTGSATQNFVDLTTAQTVGGIKTFSASPVVPTPTTGTAAANKDYVDSVGSGPTSTLFNVKTYGAVGDSTTDDTVAIQAAITAAAAVTVSGSSGATVYFPTGTYRITSALTLSASSLTFQGEGFDSSTVYQTTAGTHAFFAQDKREFVFRDMKIQGQGTGTADGIYLAAAGSYAVFDCEFTNLFIESFGRHGIHTEDICTSSFNHVRVQGIGVDGFHISDNGSSALGGTSVTFTSCFANSCTNAGYYLDVLKYSNLSGCATESCNYGYFINRCSGLSFNGCGVEETVGAAGHGFMIADGTTSCVFNACWATGIAVTTGIAFLITANGGSNSSRIVLTGCRVLGSIVPLHSAKVDTNCQAAFIGFQPHPSAGLSLIGNAQFFAHENTGQTAYGQVPASGDEPFVVWGSATTEYGYGASVKADAVRRWALRSDGRTEWGDGSAARDTNLYRSAASTLRTDATMVAANVNIGSPSTSAKLYTTYADSSTQSIGLQMIETAGTANGTAMQLMEAPTTSKRILDLKVAGDSSRRLSINAGGTITFGSGTALDTTIYRSAADVLATDDDFSIKTAGKGLQVKEGSNAKMGTSTLVGGTVTISNTSVTASSRIFLTTYIAGGTVGALYVSAKVAATSFTVTSTSGTDTSTFNYLIVEPAA